MNIHENGITLSTLSELLEEFEEELAATFGSDFSIKAEGAVDNIATSNSRLYLRLQEQIAFLAAQFDPETASGIWQDALYERIGLSRIEAQYTVFTRKVTGEANTTCDAESVIIRSSTNKYEYTNISEFTFDENGEALVDFQCLYSGEIEVEEDEEFIIVSAPDQVQDTEAADDMQLSAGCDKETDEEFRERYQNSKALNAAATREANVANLSEYVDDPSYLKVLDIKVDDEIPAGSLKIIAYHNTTDSIFAEAVYNTVAAGINLLGDTSVTIYDSEGEAVTINFQNAEEVEICIQIELEISSGYYTNSVLETVKETLIDYINNKTFGLGSTIYSMKLIPAVIECDGVENVLSIKVKSSAEDDYSESVELTIEQIPIFDETNIDITVS